MEKVIILSFVLFACVCMIQAGGDTATTGIAAPTTDVPAPSSPHSPAPEPTATTTKKPAPAKTTAPTSGAVTVKAFAGIVFSVLLIALF